MGVLRTLLVRLRCALACVDRSNLDKSQAIDVPPAPAVLQHAGQVLHRSADLAHCRCIAATLWLEGGERVLHGHPWHLCARLL
jgi:hypothetical protein